MIISASYRTDIPAFYGDWFMQRLDAGYCMVVNPYGGQLYRVGLRRDEVDGFVFWTKNLGPFTEHLGEIRRRGYPFIVQYTINGYPRALEFSVVDAARSVQHMQRLAETFGPRAAVWRYDTILSTSLTPPDFHRENFARLAESLAGATDEVVISFAQIYRKTQRNMQWAARQSGFRWNDPPDEEKRALAADLVGIAQAHGMRLAICSQRAYVVPGAVEARCIDAPRLADVAGRPIKAQIKGNRPECACHLSRDIGAYDTCPHGCVYCYAVQHRRLAQQRYQAHNPASDILFEPEETKQRSMLAPEQQSGIKGEI